MMKKQNFKPAPRSLLPATCSLLLALCSLIFISCPDIPVFETYSAPSDFPQGMGYVTLSFSDNKIVRHIKPADIERNEFSKYDIVFSASGKTDVVYERSNTNLLSEPYYVPEGTWTLTISAYISDINAGDKIAASGSVSDIVVSSGANTPVSIALSAKTTGGNGTFSWDINFDDFTYAPAKADLYVYDNSGNEVGKFNLLGTSSPDFHIGSKTIETGNYQVKLEIISASSVHQPIIYFESLDVYDNLESKLSISFNDSHYFQIFVYFDPNNGSAMLTQNADAFINKGTLLTAPASIVKTGAYLYEGTSTSSSGYVLEGWYNGDDKWNFANPVETSMILKAKWALPSSAIDVSAASGSNDVERAINYAKENAAAGRKYVLIVDAPSSEIISTQSVNNNNFDLTIVGQNDTYIKWSNFIFSSGAITLDGSIKVNSIVVMENAKITLSGSSVMEALTLNATDTIKAEAFISQGWNGSVNNLNLRGTTANTNDTISYWEGKQVFAGGGVSSTTIGKITLGDFTSQSTTNKLKISDTHIIDNDGVLKIAAAVGTSGLSFDLINSGTEYEVSMGTATDVEIVIPAAYNGKPVTQIADDGFIETDIISVTIPNSVTSIGEWAFAECSSLASITIPDSITTIGEYAFYYCESLTILTIGKGVTSIGQQAFFDCTSLTTIIIPDSVTIIGERAFGGCNSLTIINVAANNQYYSSEGGILYNKTKNELVAYPSASGNVTIPSVNTIGAGALNSSSLTSVTIPTSVTSIGNYAFDACNNLTSVTFNGTISQTNFSSTDSFPGDLRDVYLAPNGGAGTYTRTSGTSNTWTKEVVHSVLGVPGSGIAGDPYRIRTDTQLLQVMTALNTIGNEQYCEAYYELTSDITLPVPAANKGNWTPIEEFSGNFNGNGYSIIGLSIVLTSNDDDYDGDIGMFRHIGDTGIVENLGLVNCKISTSSPYVGAIIGFNEGEIRNCFVAGGQITADSCAGGLVGWNFGTIINCVVLMNSISVSDSSSVGRIVGNFDNVNTNNYAYVTSVIGYPWEKETDGKDGEDITAADWSDIDWWRTTLGFTANIWPESRLPLTWTP